MEDNNKLKEQIKLKIAISKLSREESNIAMKKNKIILPKSIFVASACLILTTGIVFANDIKEFYNTFISQKIKVGNTPSDTNYTFYKDMEQQKGIYYKKIDNYNEYLTYKKMWNDLLDMTEEDFNENFMIITAGENADTINLEVSNIYTEEDTLYLEFEEKDTSYDSSVVTGIKVDKSLSRDNIKILYKTDIAITDTNYTKITDIPSDYSTQQAITDKCIVIEQNVIISNNITVLKDFVEKSNNSIECNLRIFDIIPQGNFIKDIQFINGKYKVNIVNLNNPKDIFSEEYMFLKEHTYSMGEKNYTAIYVTNDESKVQWTPFIIFIN